MPTTYRTRPAASPAYFLGRPARVWRTALRHRPQPAGPPDLSHSTTTDRDRKVPSPPGATR